MHGEELCRSEQASPGQAEQLCEGICALTSDAMKQFNIVVLTDSNLDVQRGIGDFCHQNVICFIAADTKGLSG